MKRSWADDELDMDVSRELEDEPVIATSGILQEVRAAIAAQKLEKCEPCKAGKHKACIVYSTLEMSDCACLCGDAICDPCCEDRHNECVQRTDPDYDWCDGRYVLTNPPCDCEPCYEEDKRRGY